MNIKLYISIGLLLIQLPIASGFQKETPAIRGRVLDAGGGPLQGAAVTVTGTYLGVYTATDGTFMIKVPAAGEYEIKVSFTGYETIFSKVSTDVEPSTDLTLSQKLMMTDEVVVSSTRAGYRTPVAYRDVSVEEIEKKNSGQDIPFLLSLTPSLVETSESGTGIGYTSLRIRGTDGSRINVSIDGIPLNDAESQQVFWVDLPDLASSVENIQVQRGVGTSSNGAGAFGATLNIQTKNPENEPFAEFSSSAGSFSTLKNTMIAGTGLMADKFSFQMRYSDIRSDGYIKRSGSDNRSAFIGGSYKTARSMLKANIILGEEHTRISWWGVPADMLSTDRRFNPAGEYHDESGNAKYYDNETDNYWQNHYQLTYSFSPGKFITLHSALFYTSGKGYYEEYGEDKAYTDYGLQPVESDTSFLTSTDLIRRKWMSNDFYGLVWSLKYARDRIDAILGGGINEYDGRHFGRLIWMRNAGATEKDYEWYRNNAEKVETNIYGKLTYRFSDRLSIFGDLQYRNIRYDMTGPDDDLKDITQSHNFDFLNPKAGVFYSVSSNQDAYVSFSVANREPTRSDFKEASGDPGATPRAETLYDTEAGYNFRTKTASFGINFYSMLYRDQLVPTGELSNVGYPIMTNVKKSHRIGLELTSGIKPSDKISIILNVTLSKNKIPDFTGYYIDYNTSDWSSRYKSYNLRNVDIAYSPSLTSSGEIEYNISGNFAVGIISKYVGRQYFDNTMSKSREIDPYFVNNLRINYSPGIKSVKDAEIQLLVNNIFNYEYESNAYGGIWFEDGVENTWAYYFPQAGINFLLKLSLKF